MENVLWLQAGSVKPRRLTMRAPDLGYAPRFLSFFLALAESRFESESTLPPQAGNASRWAVPFIPILLKEESLGEGQKN